MAPDLGPASHWGKRACEVSALTLGRLLSRAAETLPDALNDEEAGLKAETKLREEVPYLLGCTVDGHWTI